MLRLIHIGEKRTKLFYEINASAPGQGNDASQPCDAAFAVGRSRFYRSPDERGGVGVHDAPVDVRRAGRGAAHGPTRAGRSPPAPVIRPALDDGERCERVDEGGEAEPEWI